MSKHVAVVGSLSLDLVLQIPRKPMSGETIAGTDFSTFVGGKGNNQALAAARAGASVSMIGRVGQDAYGDTIAGKLKAAGADTQFLFRDPQVGTGIANIWLEPDGTNSIVIVPQANARLSPSDVLTAREPIESAAVVLMQLETSIETVIAAARLARSGGALVALNPAPAPPQGLPLELLHLIDILIPNQSEAELITGIKAIDVSSATMAAQELQKLGPKTIIITLGEQGALLLDGTSDPVIIPAFPVTAIDTTAAGDAFCGALSAAIAAGSSLPDAVACGCAAGALATTRLGAEPSLPRKDEIDSLCRAIARR